MNKFQRYLLNLAVVLDEVGNTLTGGDPGETISSRAYKAQQNDKAWGCILCKFLNVFQKDHCKIANESYAGFRAIVPDGE